MTKKAAALLLAASLAVSVCATPVFATGTTHVTENSKDSATNTTTEVKYKVTEGYKWAIPATIDFGENAGVNKKRTVVADQEKDSSNYSAADANTDGSSGNVYVSDCRLKPGTKLTISISKATTMYDGTNGFYVKTTNNAALSNNTAKLYYEIYKEKVVSPATPTTGKLNNTSQILELKAGKDADKQDLTFILTTGAEGEIAGEYNGTVAFEAKVTSDATV